MTQRFHRIFHIPLLVKTMALSLILTLGLGVGLVHADPTYTLSGVVSVNSVPIPNASVRVNSFQATSDANGNYAISSLPAGNYPVTISYSPPNPPVGNATPYIFSASSVGNTIAVSGDTTRNFSFEVGTQTIHVVDSVGTVAANAVVSMAGGSNIFNGANYTFLDSTGAAFNANSMYGTANTDANGDALVPVAAGITYQTCVSTSIQTCHAVTPVAGTPTTFTIPAPGTISGVLSVNGSPIPNATVQIANRHATTDASGNFSISAVPAGNQRISLSYTPPATPITAGVPYIFNANSVNNYIQVDGNATHNLTFNVGTQTIHVIDTDGNTVSGARVTMAGGQAVFNGTTYLVPSTNGQNFVTNQLYGQANTDANGDALVPVAANLTYQTCVETATTQTCQAVTPTGSPTTIVVPSTAPAAPTGLAAPSPTKAPALTWNAVSGATQYKVYRDGGSTPIATVTQPSYTDTTVTPDGTHTYYVTAVNSGGQSSPSNTISVIVDTTRPVVSVTPVAGSPLSGTVTFTITITDANPLDPNKNKTTWVYLYNTLPPQKSSGAKVNLSSGTGTFTVNTALLANGNANLDVGIVYDAAGNASGTIDNYFRNYTITN